MLKHSPPSDYCRLCVKSCHDYQHSLYDETGQANANHDLVGKYFTNTMLNMEWERRLQYMCGKCWQHIWKFHQFQESIIEAQKGRHLHIEEAKAVQEVKIETELNINQQKVQLDLPMTKGPGTSTEDLIVPTVLSFDIKAEEPLDLNSDHEGMSSQNGQDHLTDEELSPMMSSRKENASLQNGKDDESNEDYSSSDDKPLSSLSQTNISSSKHKVSDTKRSVEEFDELVALWRNSLECDICHHLVASYSQLKEHFSKSHASEICYLMCCQLRLDSRYDILQHIDYHNAPQHLKCEVCCKAYRWVRTLRTHIKTIHIRKGGDKNAQDSSEKLEGKYRCYKCSKDFASEKHLERHIQNVHKPKILECKFCEKSFRRPEVLREHLARHTGVKTYACSACPKAFNWRSSYLAHMKKNHPQEWQKMRNEEAQREPKCGYWREIRGDSVIYICIYCFKEYNKQISVYRHSRVCLESDRPMEPTKGIRIETRGASEVYVCIYCETEYEMRRSIYHHLNQCQKKDGSVAKKASTIAESPALAAKVVIESELKNEGSLAEKASTISESPVPAEEVDIKPELNTSQLEEQLEWHNAKGLSASTKNVTKPKALTFDIKTEESDEEMSDMSSRNDNNAVVSNEDFSSSQVATPLSSLSHTNLGSSDKTVVATKRSAEEFDELVALWRSSLECDICHQLVASYSQLKEHFSKYHASEGCYLMCCQLRLATRFDIDRHIRYHNAPQQLKCEACCKAFRLAKHLGNHKRTVHTSKGGDKNAKNKDIETLQRKYRCSKCSKDFATGNQLNKHNQNVHKPKTLECNFCEKSFMRPAALRYHMASHKGEKTHACPFCPKAFTWPSDFSLHMNKFHLQEWKQMQKEEAQRKPKCGYWRETRGGSMVFVCIYCFKEYDNRHSMYYHSKQCQIYGTPVEPKMGFRLETRGKSKVHVCIYCAKEFEKLHSMYLHLKQCHRDGGSLMEEQASMICEPLTSAEKVEIEPELNTKQQEVQLECDNAKELSANNENLIKPKALTFDIKSEEPLDLNSDYEGMSPQHLEQLTDDEMSLLSYMSSSRNESSYLKNDDLSNEACDSNDDLPLSSLNPTKFCSSDKEVPAAKKSVEEFDELVVSWRSSLKCEICLQLVPNYSQLRDHFGKSHASVKCYLMCCQLRLETRNDIENHIHYHNAPQQLKCEACCKAYRLEEDIRVHKRKVHTSKGGDQNDDDSDKLQGKYRCRKCLKDFATNRHLNKHNRDVHEPKTFACNLCEKSFRRPGALRDHLATHKGEKRHLCSFCPKAFIRRSVFSLHMRKSHLQEWMKMQNEMGKSQERKKMQNEEAQKLPKCGYRRETRGESMVFVCIYCFNESDTRHSAYYHAKRCPKYDRPAQPKKGYRLESRGKSQVHVCIYCAREFEKRHSMYQHLNQCHKNVDSLGEKQAAAMTAELPVPAEKVQIKPELNKNQQEVKQEWHTATRTNVKTEQFSANTNGLENKIKDDEMPTEFEVNTWESEEFIESNEEFIEL
uniref:C2H2-type domain-containing protein n=1 Tax=Stomoxys calcitrans TaxID=35570 RepID=A0A1I8PDS2_STOCA